MTLSSVQAIQVATAVAPDGFDSGDVPADVLEAADAHRPLADGAFASVIPLQAIAPPANLPPPGGNAFAETALLQPMATTPGGGEQHAVNGWVINGVDASPAPPVDQEGYKEFRAELGLPQFVVPKGNSVYYAPATQGSDGNPLEVGIETWDGAGATQQAMYLYDWASSAATAGPCGGTGEPSCVAFSWFPVGSSFASSYLRDLGNGQPQWSLETFESGGTWYLSVYNYSNAKWEIWYSETKSEWVLKANGKYGASGGHGYFEYYLPAKTQCASGPSGNAASATTLETGAKQYSSVQEAWVAVSNQPDLQTPSPTATPFGACFSPPKPYWNLAPVIRGWGSWSATFE